MTDPTVDELMQAYAEDAVDLARDRFQTELDYSEESLEHVERILGALHDTLSRGFLNTLLRRRPSQEQIGQMAKLWGGYLGEVIRRRWGGAWTDETEAQPSGVLTLRVRGADIYPPAKVYKRLTIGAEENVWHYCQVLRRDFEATGTDDDNDRRS